MGEEFDKWGRRILDFCNVGHDLEKVAEFVRHCTKTYIVINLNIWLIERQEAVKGMWRHNSLLNRVREGDLRCREVGNFVQFVLDTFWLRVLNVVLKFALFFILITLLLLFQVTKFRFWKKARSCHFSSPLQIKLDCWQKLGLILGICYKSIQAEIQQYWFSKPWLWFIKVISTKSLSQIMHLI